MEETKVHYGKRLRQTDDSECIIANYNDDVLNVHKTMCITDKIMIDYDNSHNIICNGFNGVYKCFFVTSDVLLVFTKKHLYSYSIKDKKQIEVSPVTEYINNVYDIVYLSYIQKIVVYRRGYGCNQAFLINYENIEYFIRSPEKILIDILTDKIDDCIVITFTNKNICFSDNQRIVFYISSTNRLSYAFASETVYPYRIYCVEIAKKRLDEVELHYTPDCIKVVL